MHPGDAETYYQYGKNAFYGRGVPRDMAYARSCFEFAANGGHSKALIYLGYLHEMGWQTPPNPQLAESFYRSAAGAGEPVAKLILGLRHLRAGNAGGALPFLSDAAQAGLPHAQHLMAALYEQGLEVPKDSNTAIAWLRAATASGYAPAAARLRKLVG